MAVLSFEYLSDQQTRLRFQEAVAKISELTTKNLTSFSLEALAFPMKIKGRVSKPQFLRSWEMFVGLQLCYKLLASFSCLNK